MEICNVHNVQIPICPQQHHALPSVPASAFRHINDLLNLSPDLQTLLSWVETVHHHYQIATHNLLPTDPSRSASGPGCSSNMSSLPGTRTLKGRYKCYKCHEGVGTSKEFRRHMEEKCELLRLHHCPDCDKPYRRHYHLRDHHKRDHGCTQSRCNHLIDAARDVPPKSVLGCGYCVQWFDKAKDFISHLVKHLEARGTEPKWCDTTHVQSLLQHPRYQRTWIGLCTTRFDGPYYCWPPLTWNIVDVEQEVHDLQYGVGGQDLSLCLAKVLEKGLHFDHVSQTAKLLATCVSSPDCDTRDVTMAYDVFNDRTIHLATGLAPDEVNNLHKGWVDREDFNNTTPSTLVNTEDFWPSNVLSPTDGTKSMASDFETSFSTFDVPLDCTTEFMDFVAWDANTYDGTSHTNSHQCDPTLTSTDPLQTQVDNVEQTAMNSIPGAYAGTGTVTTYPTTSTTDIVAPMDTISSPPLDDQYIGSLSSEPMPPFNPTPRLQGRKPHKRTISGRFLSMIQNMPNTTPIY